MKRIYEVTFRLTYLVGSVGTAIWLFFMFLPLAFFSDSSESAFQGKLQVIILFLLVTLPFFGAFLQRAVIKSSKFAVFWFLVCWAIMIGIFWALFNIVKFGS